ncbi:MAG: hypothetical protein IID59_11730 [Proteobacteria bacterium]|nr:hypothetical protein [Pseudomonadota bacterium]
MNTRSKYDHDLCAAYVAISDTTDQLRTKMPYEIIAAALLQEVQQILEGFTDLEEWELTKSELLDVRNEFEKRAEPFWSNDVDNDIVAENYNKRYA